jgi:hypothetical protein
MQTVVPARSLKPHWFRNHLRSAERYALERVKPLLAALNPCDCRLGDQIP